MTSHSHPGRLLKAAAGLTLRNCDEGVLVFDDNSGKTSLLNQQGASVLRALCTEPCLDEAIARVAFGILPDNELEGLQPLISSLENSGLIVRC